MAEGQDDKAGTFRDAGRTAFVLGYTGETGKRLIKELAKDKLFKKVVLIGRREVELSSEFGPEFVRFYVCCPFSLGILSLFQLGMQGNDSWRLGKTYKHIHVLNHN